MSRILVVWAAVLSLTFGNAIAAAATSGDGTIPSPKEFFGFEMGTEGKLAAFSDVLNYMRLIAERSDRVKFDVVGKTTLGYEYTNLVISSPANLNRLDQIIEMNRKLIDPRQISEAEARRLAKESVPVFYIESSIHSTEVSNGQAINDLVYRLATEDSDFTRAVLNNVVIVLTPAQNPDGQYLVVDHFKETAGTDLARVYPDLYHKYVGHDNNRDFIFFTQPESQIRLELMKKYNPVLSHVMHQQGPGGDRMFVPPYSGVISENMPVSSMATASAVGQHIARKLAAEGKTGIAHTSYSLFYSLQSSAYFPFRGGGMLLTEIANGTNLAYPYVSPDGKPLGPQLPSMRIMQPYRSDTWTLKQQVEYGKSASYAAMEYVARNGEELLFNNLYSAPRQYTENGVPSGSYAFVIPANQRDPYATYEMLKILEMTDVEIHQAQRPFSAGGKQYAAGAYVILLHQPLANWAHQLLGIVKYPIDEMAYMESSTNVHLLLGVDVDEVGSKFTADLVKVDSVTLPKVAVPAVPGPGGVFMVRPESYGTVPIVAALQQNQIATYRAAESFRGDGVDYPAGTFIVPATEAARGVLQAAAAKVGVQVYAAAGAPAVSGIQLKPGTRVGLFRGANNMPGGWDMWLMDQYGINYSVVASEDFKNSSLNDLYDTIVISSGITKTRMIEGLKPELYDRKYSWAFGIGDDGWKKLQSFVYNGGTLVALGSAVDTARELMAIEGIAEALPKAGEFTTGGSLLWQEYDTNNPIAWGMPKTGAVWLYRTQAWALTGKDRITVVSRYPDRPELLASGYLRGEAYLRNAVNTFTVRRGDGLVVGIGSEPTFRSWPRSNFPLVFNAIYNGPAKPVNAEQLKGMQSVFSTNSDLVLAAAGQ